MLQFTHLFEPISDAAPTGVDLSFSSEVDAISLARQFDDPSLDQGEWVVALKEADWPFVYDKCLDLLNTQTKDMRIAGWLLEAAVKTREFDGMAAGFELLTGLCDRYWNELHPLVDDGDLEQRVGNLRWLVTRSVSLAKEVPLTEGRNTVFSWSDFEVARARANTALRTGERAAENADQPELATMEAARRKSSKAFYENLVAGITRTIAAITDCERVLDTHLGLDGPSFTPLKDILATVRNTVERFGNDVGMRLASEHTADAAIAVSSSASVTSPVVHAGPIRDRNHALEQLRQVAEFFRRTEPHSPVAYLADKAAAWGDMPLHTWLKSVVKDATSLAFIEEMLDVKQAE